MYQYQKPNLPSYDKYRNSHVKKPSIGDMLTVTQEDAPLFCTLL